MTARGISIRRYAAELRERIRDSEPPKDDSRAFLGGKRDDLAEQLGEEAVEKMTSGEDDGEDVANQEVAEETGGPFVVTSGGTEFASGTDASNPEGADREPFPTT